MSLNSVGKGYQLLLVCRLPVPFYPVFAAAVLDASHDVAPFWIARRHVALFLAVSSHVSCFIPKAFNEILSVSFTYTDLEYTTLMIVHVMQENYHKNTNNRGYNYGQEGCI